MPPPAAPTTPTFNPPPCPNCSAPRATLLGCAACGALFRNDQADVFSLMGLPAQYTLDLPRLDAGYLAISRLAHPDRHVSKSDDAQELAEVVMAQANRARQVLLDDRLRAEALWQRLGGNGSTPKKQPEPAFLMEVMELTEQLAGAGDSEKAALTDNIRARLNAMRAELTQQFAATPPPLTAIRDTLDRMAYWNRMLENATGTGEHKLVH